MNMLKALKSCFNPKVLLGILIIIILLNLWVPKLAGVAYLLVALICPVSMLVMMKAMQRKEPKVDSNQSMATKE